MHDEDGADRKRTNGAVTTTNITLVDDRGWCRHMAFQVNDLAEAEKRLIAHAVHFTKYFIPGTNPRKYQLFFFDPDHNGIELGNYMA